MKNREYKYVSYATSLFVILIVTGIFVLLFTIVINLSNNQNINPDDTKADSEYIRLVNSPLVLNQGVIIQSFDIQIKGFSDETKLALDLGCGRESLIKGKIQNSKFIPNNDQTIEFCNINGKGYFIPDYITNTTKKFEFEYLPVYAASQKKCTLIDLGSSSEYDYSIKVLIADNIEQPIRKTTEESLSFEFGSSCSNYKVDGSTESILNFKLPNDKKNCVLQAKVVKTYSGSDENLSENYLCSVQFINKGFNPTNVDTPTRTLPIETSTATKVSSPTETTTSTQTQKTPTVTITKSPTTTKTPVLTTTKSPSINQSPTQTVSSTPTESINTAPSITQNTITTTSSPTSSPLNQDNIRQDKGLLGFLEDGGTFFGILTFLLVLNGVVFGSIYYLKRK